ncbi:nucleoid-associated protein YejK [Aestuariibacter sp. AA17]|uniref:Nucleoid-associated protein YejK n=1 Tax=Fluctibacter corallii TaxID=2984329 RepID=A0ABT3A992_9ALTE|nr:nucleoid-associated protein YejK [Aestuariibacter sp. AA17]MCV2885243.1 nucleoid-associated protein YejK [Aestuariibacter sp. AA17]
MSAVIHHFVVHRLSINEQQELVVNPRNACFDVSADIEELAHQINHAFNTKPGKGVGGFIEADNIPETEDNESSVDAEQVLQFRTLLQNMMENPDNFVEFSVKSSELLKKSLLNAGTVETGFVIFSHYEFLATEYLMISLLNTREHVEINANLELNHSDHLDLAKMQLAVRIDLTQLHTTPEQNRYIAFIKGRMGRKVSDFFMNFVGCQELVDVKQQNKQLLNSVDEYLSSEQLDPQEKQQNREVVAQYYKEKIEQGEDIQLRELADKLPKDSDNDFYQFNQQTDAPLEENFQADKTMLKSLAKFTGQGGGISLSFDRKLFGERVMYNPETDTLMIKGIPPNLKDQLLKAK